MITEENGAGKSTLMKILFHPEAPSFEGIFLNGEKSFRNPSSVMACEAGVGQQYFMILGATSIGKTIAYSLKISTNPFSDKKSGRSIRTLL